MVIFSLTPLLVLFCSSVCSQNNHVLEAFMDDDIFEALSLTPQNTLGTLSIYFDFFVESGTEYSRESSQETPAVDLSPFMEYEKNYTLIMADPDALSRSNPVFRSYLHWIVSDLSFQNSDLRNGDVTYVGPGPPKGTGLHRYIFLLFEQTCFVDLGGFSNENRKSFNVGEFASGNNMKLIAGNYFLAQNK
uniref:Protein D1 n=1 Tax=Lepeophtheirus salmonis TaxID=72036 RepID=D3PI70_LEPSM|nr:Protein D1 [Lepeophtheirus salmonis]